MTHSPLMYPQPMLGVLSGVLVWLSERAALLEHHTKDQVTYLAALRTERDAVALEARIDAAVAGTGHHPDNLVELAMTPREYRVAMASLELAMKLPEAHVLRQVMEMLHHRLAVEYASQWPEQVAYVAPRGVRA